MPAIAGAGAAAQVAGEGKEPLAGQACRSAPDGARRRQRELLARLSQRVLPAIVRVGRARARGHLELVAADGRESDDDAWLSIVHELCLATPAGDEDDPRAVDPARALVEDARLSALAPLVERIEQLRRVPLFHAMKPHNLLQVADACEERRYPAGAEIFRQGESDDALCLLLEGEVDILRDGERYFGEIALKADASTRR